MREPEETPAQQLEHAILGEEVVYNALEVAAETGVSIEQAQRLWRALGFPDRGAERAFTQADAEAVSTLLRLVDEGAIGFDMAVDLTRAVGQTMARLADWEVGTLVHRVQEMESGTDATGSRATAALQLWRGDVLADLVGDGFAAEAVRRLDERRRCGQQHQNYGGQELVRHLGLCHFVERLTSAVQWNDVVDLDTLQRCDRVAHIVLLVRREVEPADHRVNLADTRSRLGLFDCVDYPAMAARR